jgi:hypothetical protein
VVVRTLTVVVVTTVEVTTVARVGKEVVRSSSVIVLTGKEFVNAGTVNRSMTLPDGTRVVPLTTVTSGPPRMSYGPAAVKTSVALLGSVNSIVTLFLVSKVFLPGMYPTGSGEENTID